MMSFSEQVLDDIRAQANIVDVIGDYITLEKRGRNHFGCCPFHQEDTPSFSVSEEKQFFHCFGCHEGGNVFTFVMKHEGLSFQEAVLHVARYTNIDPASLQGQITPKKSARHESYYELMQFVSDVYAYMLQTDKGKRAKTYLRERGISEREIETFRIGFAPNEQLLEQLLTEKGYSIEKARELGLLFESKDMTKHYDAFRGRIVFPITDKNGNIVAFTGRLIDEGAEAGQPKYFHSPESLIFRKREVLYNYSFAKNEIKKAKELYVCEGIFDVIALARADVPNGVCTLGTALSHEQLQLLGQTKSKVYFVFDNDKAGKHAMLKALRLGAEHKLDVGAITFWQYAEKDLDELIASVGATKLQAVLTQKQSLNDYYLQYYESTLNLANNEEKQEFVQKMIDILQYSTIQTQDHYYQLIQTKTGYSDAAFAAFKKIKAEQSNDWVGIADNKRSHRPPIRTPRLSAQSGQERSEQLIIKGLLKGEGYVDAYKKNPVFSQNKTFRDLIWKIIDYAERNAGTIDVVAFNKTLAQNEIAFLITSFNLQEPITPTIFQKLLTGLQQTTEFGYLKEAATQTKHQDRERQIAAIQQLADFKKKLDKSEEK